MAAELEVGVRADAVENRHFLRFEGRWISREELRENQRPRQIHHFKLLGLHGRRRYPRILTALRRKGRPIPTNDIWIAAHAMETGAYLVSSDLPFEEIDGLAWINPSS